MPLVLVPVGTPRGAPLQLKNKTFMGPCEAHEGTNTKVTSAKGHFCAYPTNKWGSTVGFQEFLFQKFMQSSRESQIPEHTARKMALFDLDCRRALFVA